MVLVPATMTLLGRWNWWLPAFAARRTPAAAEPVEHELTRV
jgi:putative drug exporter of the RND superfamily